MQRNHKLGLGYFLKEGKITGRSTTFKGKKNRLMNSTTQDYFIPWHFGLQFFQIH